MGKQTRMGILKCVDSRSFCRVFYLAPGSSLFVPGTVIREQTLMGENFTLYRFFIGELRSLFQGPFLLRLVRIKIFMGVQ